MQLHEMCSLVNVDKTDQCSFVESSRKKEDCVVLQCREKNQLCVARLVEHIMCIYLSLLLAPPCIYTIVYGIYLFSYNVEDDQVNCFLRIPMEKVEKIVIGIYISNHSRCNCYFLCYYRPTGHHPMQLTQETTHANLLHSNRLPRQSTLPQWKKIEVEKTNIL